MPAPKGHPKWGGKQKGSKHKKTIEKEMAIKMIQDKVLEKWESLVDRKIELAEGVFVIKKIKVGGQVIDAKVYKEKPDAKSLEYLFSVIVGKPVLPIEVIKPIPLLDYVARGKEAPARPMRVEDWSGGAGDQRPQHP